MGGGESKAKSNQRTKKKTHDSLEARTLRSCCFERLCAWDATQLAFALFVLLICLRSESVAHHHRPATRHDAHGKKREKNPQKRPRQCP